MKLRRPESGGEHGNLVTGKPEGGLVYSNQSPPEMASFVDLASDDRSIVPSSEFALDLVKTRDGRPEDSIHGECSFNFEQHIPSNAVDGKNNRQSSDWPFGELPLFRHNIIYADPPWPFHNYSAKGESRNPNRHYATMSIDQIMALPVGHLAARDCACFLWVTDPLLDRGIEVLRAWGFTYKTVAFTWAKRTKLDAGWHIGTGYTTRSNPEMCLLGMMGSLPRQSASVRQLIVEPVRQHSRKPDRVPEDIVRLYGNLPRLELFARTQRPGWAVWGNEISKFETEAA